MKKYFLLLLFCSLSLRADQFLFQFYNDYFDGKDQHFTNGLALGWVDNDKNGEGNRSISSYSDFMLKAVDKIPFVDVSDDNYYTAGASISQIMITPKKTGRTTVQYDDLPYAGYLALSMFVFEWDMCCFKEYRLDFGVVGRESGAEYFQESFHKMIHEHFPEGWDTQLKTHYTANALFRYGQKSWQKENGNGLEMDWFNQGGVQLGNFTTDAFAGTMFRFGKKYPHSFNVHYPYLREEAALLHICEKHKGFGWSVSTGLNAELLAYSYILDGAKSEGYHTDKNILNGSLYLGGDLYYNTHKFTFFYQAQSSYIVSQKGIDVFGGVIYAYQF